MADEDDIHIRGEFENNISRPADAAARSIDNLGDEAVETAAEIEVLEAAEKSAAGTTKKLGDETDRASNATRIHSRRMREHRRETQRTTTAYRAYHRIVRASAAASMMFGKGLVTISDFSVRVRRGLTMAFGPLAMVSKIFAMVEAVTLLATALKGLGAGALVAANGFGPLVGLLAAYPALYAAAIQGGMAVKLGTSGLGEAWKVMNDPKATSEQKDKAFKNMSDEGLAFLSVIKQIQPRWTRLKKSIQGKLFKGMAQDLKPLANIYLPILDKYLGKTATNINKVVRANMKWMKTDDGIRIMTNFMRNNSVIVGKLATLISGLIRLLVILSITAGPMVKRMLDDITGGIRKLNLMLRDNGDEVSDWLVGSWERFKSMLSVAFDFLTGVYYILKAATPWTEEMGAGLSEAAKNFAKWSKSVEGQKQIKKFFEEFMPVFYVILGLAGDLIKMIMRIGSSPEFIGLIQKIRTDVLPILEQLFKTSQGKFIPAILDIFTALADIANSGFIDIFAGFLKQIAGYITDFAAWFKGLSPEMKKLVVGLVATFFLFGRLLAPLGKMFIGFGKLILRIFGKGGVIGKLGKTKLFAPLFKMLKGGGGKGAEKGIFAVLTKIAPKLAAFAGPVGAVIAILSTLATVFFFLYQNSQQFRDGIGEIGAFIQQTWSQIAGTFMQSLAPIGESFNQILQQLGYEGGMAGFMKLLGDVGNAVWPFLIGMIIGTVEVLGQVIQVIIQVIAWFVNMYLQLIQWGIAVDQAIGTAIAMFERLVTFIALNVYSIWNKITFAWRTAVSTVMNWIYTTVSGAIGRVKTAIEGIRGIFSTAFSGAKAAIQPVLDILQTVGDKIGTVISAASSVGQTIANLIPGFFAGGTMKAGQLSIVGERGPETLINPNGGASIVGANGPQLIMPKHNYAVVNAAATVNPFGGGGQNSPSWAVNALKKAYGAQGAPSVHNAAGRGSEPTVQAGDDNSTTLTIEKLIVGENTDLEQLEIQLRMLLAKIQRDKKRNR